jgi:D-cysteine desulfhydrase
MKAHLLLRGERPGIPTGYNLVAGMYGYVKYIPRSEYADRQTMLQKYAMQVAGDPSCVVSLSNKVLTESSVPGNAKRVAILNEGAGDCHAILGSEDNLTRDLWSLVEICFCAVVAFLKFCSPS